MQEAKHLKPFMQACFNEAKDLLTKSERLVFTVAVFAIFISLIPENCELWSMIAGIAALCLLGLQQVTAYLFRKKYELAEKIRRIYLLSDGLGRQISESEIASLQKKHGDLVPDETPYYTSHLEPSTQRLLMLVWESVFFTEDLQGEMAGRFFWKAILTTMLVITLLILAFYGPEVATISKIAPSALSFYLTLNYWGMWRQTSESQRECSDIADRCRMRVENGEFEPTELGYLREVMQIVLDHSTAALLAYPPPDKIYRSRRDELNNAWNRIVEGLSEGSS